MMRIYYGFRVGGENKFIAVSEREREFEKIRGEVYKENVREFERVRVKSRRGKDEDLK